MTFGHPLLLLTLLLIPAALVAYRLATRRRMEYAVRYTNVDVLASVVATGRPWRRWLMAGVFLLALATLCAALSRPHVHRLVVNDNATVVLVLDVSGSMEAQDVKPTRLAAAQRALHAFLAKVPARLKVGLVLFAGEAQVATPPTTDHALVAQAVDDAGFFRGFGGTAIGDAIATAVRVGLRSAGLTGELRDCAAVVAGARRVRDGRTPRPASTLVSILFLSDGHQTRGVLAPLARRRQGAGGRHPGVHGRARNDRQHDDARLPRRRRLSAPAAAAGSAGPASLPTRRRCAPSPTARAASSSARNPPARSSRPTRRSARRSAASRAASR